MMYPKSKRNRGFHRAIEYKGVSPNKDKSLYISSLEKEHSTEIAEEQVITNKIHSTKASIENFLTEIVQMPQAVLQRLGIY
jgi:hypothetical protein